jgi:hypothetical protein
MINSVEQMEKIERVVMDSLTRVANDNRWSNAIHKAKKQIEDNPYIHYENGSLLVLSESGKIYSVESGCCECKAFESGKPCWHRAAKRLLDRIHQEIEH